MRPASQKVMAFCAVLSETSAGMPGNDSVCARSTMRMPRENQPTSITWLLRSRFRRFHARATTMSEMAIDVNSRIVCRIVYWAGSEKNTTPGSASPRRKRTVSPIAQPVWWVNRNRGAVGGPEVVAIGMLPSRSRASLGHTMAAVAPGRAPAGQLPGPRRFV